MAAVSQDITKLLRAWRAGDERALEVLVPQVEAELRRLARHYLRQERSGHTLQTTALVNEAYLKLIDWKSVQWQDRAHLLGVSAGLMRRILVDHARRNNYLKRGGGALKVSLDEGAAVSAEPPQDLLAIDTALNELTAMDPRKGQVVELRFFGGLSVKETSEVLQISERTVKREWNMARAWLYCNLTGEELHDA
jgi:RNA polymerase sigma factor (TIGR02999 family)